MEATNKPSRESAKGKTNKYDAKHIPKQAKFPMRTYSITEDLLQYCKDCFPEFEFLFMLFGVIMVLFALVLHLKLFFPSMIETNLVLYLTFTVILIAVQNLNKDAFVHGYFKYSDETKVSLLFAVKTFIIVWIMLAYTDGAAA